MHPGQIWWLHFLSILFPDSTAFDTGHPRSEGFGPLHRTFRGPHLVLSFDYPATAVARKGRKQVFDNSRVSRIGRGAQRGDSCGSVVGHAGSCGRKLMMTNLGMSHLPAEQSLLARINWRAVGARTAAELRNREVHAPVVSTYRWWARRPHSVMGALLDAALDKFGPELIVSDPFSGGGTVTFEAARRGLKAYAQDVYPWPARGLTAALASCDQDALSKAAQSVLSQLAPHRDAYKTAEGCELSHILRVRVAECQTCDKLTYEFSHALVSVASRSVHDKSAFYGCRVCGHVTLRPRGVQSFSCDGCGKRWAISSESAGCVHCHSDETRPVAWHAVLVQELTWIQGRLRAILRPAKQGDPVMNFAPADSLHPALAQKIPTGLETKRLLDNGLAKWGDLYTQRQAAVLVEGLQAVASLDCAEPVRDRLAFVLLGSAELPAFLSRWDRFNLKPFEAMANHRYTQTTLAVESNLLSPVGRGTIPRRLEASSAAIQWLVQSRERPPKVVATNAGKRGGKRADWDILVTTGSSVKQALGDSSVNVVLTDPPYFDDVQYGELARLFHVWLSVYDPSVVVDETAEASPNRMRGVSAADYEATIAACLRESLRTLKPDGRLILTFHNKKVAAWRALAGALTSAGLRVSALAAVLAENRADHCKRYVNAMLHDLVIECVPAASGACRTSLEFAPRSVDEKNLAAMGLALADSVNKKVAAALSARYMHYLSELGVNRRLIA